MKKIGIGAVLSIAAFALAGCPGDNSSVPFTAAAVTPATAVVTGDVPVPNFVGPIAGGGNTAGSFDLVYVDQANHTASFTDRNNKSIDQITYSTAGSPTGALKQFSAGLGFTGCQSASGVAAPGCPSAAGVPPPSSSGVTGPNGLHGLVGTTTVIAGDVQKIVALNSSTGALIATIPTTNPIAGNTGFRTDEGCVMPAGKLPAPFATTAIAAFSNTGEAAKTITGVTRGQTFWTFVRLDTNAVIGQLVMPYSSGQELCLFDTSVVAPIMYFTDDGDIAAPPILGVGAIANVQGAGATNAPNAAGSGNPFGSLDGLHVSNLLNAFAAAPAGINGNKYIILDLTANVAADALAGFYPATAVGIGATLALADYKTTPATGIWHRVSGFDNVAPAIQCTPAGMALNTTNNVDVAQSCRPPQVGGASVTPLALLIINRNTGALIAQPLGGGADQVQFDPVGNLYLTAAARWTANGLSVGSCAAARLCTPVLSIINATSFAIVNRVPVGNNAHGVDFDSAFGVAIMPYSNSTQPAGCGSCGTIAAPSTIFGGVHTIKYR